MTSPSVADVVGATIATQGVKDAFGVLGSGNLVVTNALTRGGARFHHARHEGSATCMADGYARTTGRVGVVSVHQGPGLTNTLTGLTEAAKSRTPLLVLAGDSPAAALTSNFRIDQHDLVESVGVNRGPGAQPKDRRRRRAARVRTSDHRAPARRADAADRHPAAAGAGDRAGAATEPGVADRPARPGRDQRDRGSAEERTKAGDHRRPRRRALRRERRTRVPRPPHRRAARHIRARERSVQRAPLRARDLGRLRIPRTRPSSFPRPTCSSCSAPRSTTGRRSTAR